MLGHACVHPHSLLSPATSQLSSESLACSLMKQNSSSQTAAARRERVTWIRHARCYTEPVLLSSGGGISALSLSLSLLLQRKREDRLWKWKRGFFSPPPTQAAELRGAPSLRGSLIFESQNTCCCLPLDRQEAGGYWAEVGWGGGGENSSHAAKTLGCDGGWKRHWSIKGKTEFPASDDSFRYIQKKGGGGSRM